MFLSAGSLSHDPPIRPYNCPLAVSVCGEPAGRKGKEVRCTGELVGHGLKCTLSWWFTGDFFPITGCYHSYVFSPWSWCHLELSTKMQNRGNATKITMFLDWIMVISVPNLQEVLIVCGCSLKKFMGHGLNQWLMNPAKCSYKKLLVTLFFLLLLHYSCWY